MSKEILIATIMRPEGDTGVQTHFHTYKTYLREMGRQCGLITPYSAPLWQVYPVFGLRKLVNFINREASVWWHRYWHAVFLCVALRQTLANGQPCVVYAQCPLSADAALRARVSPQQRVVMVVHFNISQADEWAGKGAISEGGHLFQEIRGFEAEVLPRLDGLVFVSEFMRRELVARIPAIGSILYRVVPNFLRDPEMVGPNTVPVMDLICIGTLEPRKNQRYALEIVAASRRIGRPLSLTVVGDGPDRTALETLARELGLGDLIRISGYVKQAADIMLNHRACLHVARMESFGIVLVEAMSRGLPVFAPAVGGVPEVFRDGEEGRFIPLDNADSVARLIIEWLDSEATMQKARITARRRYLGCFEANNVAAKLTAFLDAPFREMASP